MQRRFPHREDLGRDGVYNLYWAPGGLPREDVMALLELIEEEYFISAGILRPDDSLEKLLPPVRTRNPLRWWACEPRLEDATSEVDYRLAKRIKAGVALEPRGPLKTINDLVYAWCGVHTRPA